jgi:hypothetical protein
MSTIVVLKEADILILGTDSRFMKHDNSGVESDSGKKIFEIAQQTFIAASGWVFGCEFERQKAWDLAIELATTDIRIISEALRREFTPYLKDLVATSSSVEGLHTYGGSRVCGNTPVHASVMVGRDARGKLGYVTQEYSLREGEIVNESSEYFREERQIWVRPGEPVISIAQDPHTWTDNPATVIRRFLTALKAANPRIGGPDQMIELDRDGAHWLSQLPASAAASSELAHATVNVGGGGLSFSGAGGITVANGGNINCDPGTVNAHDVRCNPLGGAFWHGSEQGLTTTRVVQDGSGYNKTVYIKGGIIVGWDL